MKNYFQKFKDIGKTEEKNLDVVVSREPVSVLIVADYEWVEWHIKTALEKIRFPTDLVSFNHYKEFNKKYNIVYGMHHHKEGVKSFEEIGKFRNLGDFLIYSDCCRGKQGESCGADVWVCDDYVAAYTAWAIKDISEDNIVYLNLGRDYAGILQLALKNKDFARAKQFAEIARFEIDDVDEDLVFHSRMTSQLGLAEIIFNSGNKELVIDHYKFIGKKIEKEAEGAKEDPEYQEFHKKRADKNFGALEHIHLFERHNSKLGITPREFNINKLKENYGVLK